jgi:DNA-binding PadR family transcriptional regulator
MGKEGLLGSFEELVMLAVTHIGKGAYGMTVRRLIGERSGRPVTIGAVYATLERLTSKGLLAVRSADASEQRDGRARRYYELLPAGAEALRKTHAVHKQMWAGLDPTSLVRGA